MKRYDFDLVVYNRLYYQKDTQLKIALEMGCSPSTISYRHRDFEQINILINVLSPSATQLMSILESSVFKNYADMDLCEMMISHVMSENWIKTKDKKE